MDRTTQVRALLATHKLDALLLTNLVNIRYVSGFTGSTASVVITHSRSIILVDSRYVLQAGQECVGYEVVQFSGDILTAATEMLNEMSPARLGFEADFVTYSSHRKLRRLIKKSIRLVGTKGLVESLRLVKDAEEVEKIRLAAKLVDDCFDYIVGFVKPGMTEREVALEIDVYLRRHGAEKQGFDTIAAAGPNAAFPHHQPTYAVLELGQMVKLDYGALLNGYNSDITRTIFLGPPDAKQREVYATVLAAQQSAIEAIRPGKIGKEIDAVARDYIKDHGYGDYFGHGLGHSLGIDVHDGGGLTTTSEIVLAPGMVMTVEPGIYIEGWGGVRIEDDIVVTETGVEVLTHATKDVIVIG